MRQLVALAICSSIAILGCTKRNPEVCCVTDAECKAVGFDSPSPCGEGVCVQNGCVAAGTGCDDDGDCTDPAAPMCVSGQCYGEVEACQQGGGQRIVFVSTQQDPGVSGLYSMYENGTKLEMLTSNIMTYDQRFLDDFAAFDPTSDVSMTMSPDLETIAFIAPGPAVFTAGLDGQNITQVTDPSMQVDHAEWSPDGTRFAVSTMAVGQVEKAYIVRTDGSHALPILVANTTSNYDVVWSPDGSKIAFASKTNDKNYVYTSENTGAMPQIFDQSDGMSFDNLTFNTPAWAPNGSVLAYITIDESELDVNLKRFDGSPVKPVMLPDTSEVEIAWSHDSSQLAVVRGTGSSHSIWLMNADGSNLTQLTPYTSNDRHPRWSPDDHYILFDTHRDGDPEVYRMDRNGANQINITNRHGQSDDLISDYGAEWVACPTSPSS